MMKTDAIVKVIVFAVAYTFLSIHADENIMVHTKYGDVLGSQTDIARIFYGIPFAQPPIHELR